MPKAASCATIRAKSPTRWSYPRAVVNKTILDTVRSIEKVTGAKVLCVEGQPELSGMPSGILVGNM